MAESDILETLARRYVGWKAPADAMRFPSHIVAQVMNIGDYADVQHLIAAVGEDTLRDTLAHAEAGQFNGRSWAYWHYRLGLAPAGRVPPMPARPVG